ncbi:MAG: selenium cofactor biosynthesis protein YqeC [Haloarcula sp.]
MRLADVLGLGSRELVSFVGAGGKKTAMKRLTATGTSRGLDVGYTTTTAMPPPPEMPLIVTASSDFRYTLSRDDPPIAFAREWVKNPERVDRKVRGFDPTFLKSVFYSGLFDWVLVKADGARMREFKAPNEAEPVVPAATTHVVPVVSVHAVGESLTEEVVHRPECVAAITDLSVGDTITPEAMGSVLASPEGSLRHVPSSATVTPLVNKADTKALRDTARAVVNHAIKRTTRFSRGVVTSLENDICEPVEQPTASR